MNELEDFYSGLYSSEGNLADSANLFLRHSEMPKLSPGKAATCEGKPANIRVFSPLKKTNHPAMTDLL